MLKFIVNPAARSWHSMQSWTRIEEKLKKHKVPYEVFYTDAPSHATRLAAELTEHYSSEDVIGVLGGDGTLNEVAAGLKLSAVPTLFYVPCGSGNDFARGSRLQITADTATDLVTHLDRLSLGKVDVGTTQLPGRLPHRFVVSSGIGFDAAVCYDMGHSKVKSIANSLHCGSLAYLITGLKNMLFCPLVKGELLLDDETVVPLRHLAFMSAHNLPYEGGGFYFAPRATSEDGLIDLCVVTAPIHLIFIATLAASVFGGRHLKLPNVKYFQCRRAELRLNKKLCVHTDGEVQGLFDRVTFSASEGFFRVLR